MEPNRAHGKPAKQIILLFCCAGIVRAFLLLCLHVMSVILCLVVDFEPTWMRYAKTNEAFQLTLVEEKPTEWSVLSP